MMTSLDEASYRDLNGGFVQKINDFTRQSLEQGEHGQSRSRRTMHNRQHSEQNTRQNHRTNNSNRKNTSIKNSKPTLTQYSAQQLADYAAYMEK